MSKPPPPITPIKTKPRHEIEAERLKALVAREKAKRQRQDADA